MKRAIASLAAFAAFTPLALAEEHLPTPGYHTFYFFEQTLDIAGRDAAGTLEPEIELSQGKIGDEEDAQDEVQKGNPENAAKILAALRNRVLRNLEFLRNKHVPCALRPNTCASYNPDLQVK